MNQDYKQLLSQVIKKQIVILGPDITLAKARNVPGLVVADDGSVTDISGDQQQITQKLIDQFVQLSGEIVRKTMEPLLTLNQTPAPAPAAAPAPVVTPAVTAPSPQVAVQTSPQTVTPPIQPSPSPSQTVTPNPATPAQPPVHTPLAQDTKPVQ